MKKRILWLSRHSPTSTQKNILEATLCEPIDIIQVGTTVRSHYEVREMMEHYKCDDIVAVLPLSIIAQLCSIGINPIRPVPSKRNGEETEFNDFVRVEKVEVVQHPLEGD